MKAQMKNKALEIMDPPESGRFASGFAFIPSGLPCWQALSPCSIVVNFLLSDF
jgi:hypothetical protein